MLYLTLCELEFVSYSVVSYLYARISRLITSGGFLLSITCGSFLPLGALERLPYFIVALPGPSI